MTTTARTSKQINRFPTRRSLLLGGVAALATLGFAGWRFASNTAAPTIGGPFSLVDGAGKRWTDADFRGKFLLVYFGYTFCPDVCPTALGELSAALDRLSGAQLDQLQVVFVSVDPKRDFGPRLAEYGKAFHERIMGLTGTREEIDAMASAYGAKYRFAGDPATDDYAIDHTSIVYVMGRDGAFVTQFTHNATPEQMRAKLDAVIR